MVDAPSSVSRVISRNKGVNEVEVKQMENIVFVTYDETLVTDELIISPNHKTWVSSRS